jgi:hypothetical protein
MGGASGTGVLRCAQDDSKNKQQQEQATAETDNDKNLPANPVGTKAVGATYSKLRIL